MNMNVVPPSPYDLLSRDELLMKWNDISKQAKKAADEEMTLRKYIVKRQFPDAEEGTHNLDLGSGYKLKTELKLNYNVGKTVVEVLKEIANIDEIGKSIAENLVSWSPKLKVGEYRKIDNKYKDIFNKVLTITEGSPTLEIVEPKERK